MHVYGYRQADTSVRAIRSIFRAGTERCHVQWLTPCNVSRERHVTSSAVSLGHYTKTFWFTVNVKQLRAFTALRFIEISNCTFNHAREPFFWALPNWYGVLFQMLTFLSGSCLLPVGLRVDKS